jgi:DNA-binding NarL/FixJ family response regulator
MNVTNRANRGRASEQVMTQRMKKYPGAHRTEIGGQTHGFGDAASRSLALGPLALNSGPNAQGVDIVFIEDRPFLRECVWRSLQPHFANRVHMFPSVSRWCEVANTHTPGAIIVSLRSRTQEAIQQILESVQHRGKETPVIILSDVEELDHIVEMLESGARGYIPTSISLQLAVQAVRLVIAGGVFAPAQNLLEFRPAFDTTLKAPLTERQRAVWKVLQRGKSNKEIAKELEMGESAVRAAVRGLLKKMNVTTRDQLETIGAAGRRNFEE